MKRVFTLFLFIVVFGCSSKPFIVNNSGEYSGTGKNKIYVVSHGWHTGFVAPANYIYKEIPELKTRFGNTESIEFGWGDKGFYQAEEITSGLTLKAILWPTESVIHAVSVPNDVYEYFPTSEIETLCLSNKELSSLISFISNSFYKNKNGDVAEQKNGIYGNSQFYKGVGSFYLMNTCNKWTAKGLKSAGLDISTTFKLTSGSIINYLEKKRRDRFYPDKAN